jgi:hypothetical protein
MASKRVGYLHKVEPKTARRKAETLKSESTKARVIEPTTPGALTVNSASVEPMKRPPLRKCAGCGFESVTWPTGHCVICGRHRSCTCCPCHPTPTVASFEIVLEKFLKRIEDTFFRMLVAKDRAKTKPPWFGRLIGR